jgi:hypothetical protein
MEIGIEPYIAVPLNRGEQKTTSEAPVPNKWKTIERNTTQDTERMVIHVEYRERQRTRYG